MDTLKNVNIPQTKPADDAVNVSNIPATKRGKKTSGTRTRQQPKNGAAEGQVQIVDDAELKQQLEDCKSTAADYHDLSKRTDDALYDALAKSYVWWRACTQVEKRFTGYLKVADIKARNGRRKFSPLIRLTFGLNGNVKGENAKRLETKTVNRFATALAAIDRHFATDNPTFGDEANIVAHIRQQGGVEALIQQQFAHEQPNKADDWDTKKEEVQSTHLSRIESFFRGGKRRTSFTEKDLQHGEGGLVPLVGRVGKDSKVDVVGIVPCAEEVFKILLLNTDIGLDQVPDELNFFSEVLSLGEVIKDNMPSKCPVDDDAGPRLKTTDMLACQRLLLVQGSGAGAVVALTRAESSIVLHANPKFAIDWPFDRDVYMDTGSRRWFETNVIPPFKRRHFSCEIAQSDATKQSDVCITVKSPQMDKPRLLHLRGYEKWAKDRNDQEKHLMVDVDPNIPWHFEATIASDEFEKINREHFKEYSKRRKAKGRAAVLDMRFDNQTWKIRHDDGLKAEHAVEVSEKVKKALWMSFVASDIAAVAQKVVDLKLTNAIKIHGSFKGLLRFDIETKVGSYVIYIPTVLENRETHNTKLLGKYPVDRRSKDAVNASS